MNFIIETNRLLLRELTLEDSDKLSLVLTDPVSMKFYPKPFTSEDVRNWIRIMGRHSEGRKRVYRGLRNYDARGRRAIFTGNWIPYY